ncbi:membrane protein [Ornithinimicrobium tianjinense]|uniref:Membrane protein n=1 Tax=Ornithinimicrobium tianjinense TaxID=1195761 RepID=A0A917FAV5_9MICO|nr:membrane protein [Ornithinimicrobium tianjinense]
MPHRQSVPVPARHRLLAVLVAVMWGLNFIAIDASLQHFPPLFLVALRFAVIAIPTVLLVPWPGVPARWLLGYGLGFGVLQFLFLYWGMAAGMPVGLASLVLQASAPFTVLLGATFLRERVGGRQLLGILVAVAGLTVVAWQRAEHATLLPFLLTLAGALGWAVGNICNRQARPASPLRLTLWMSVVPPLPMLALSVLVEGPDRILRSLLTLDAPAAPAALLGLAYTVVIGTVAGSGVWTWLMARHPAGVVGPFSMLVPVVGMTSAWLVLGERVTAAELAGAVLVVGGVLLGSRPRRPSPAQTPPTQTPPAQEPDPVGATTTAPLR